MAGSITGLGTTYNLPNYTGILHQLTPSDTPFFSAIGGLTGGGQTDSIEFEWQEYDLRAAGQNVALEGQDAPSDENRVRNNVTNICQIHHEAVGVSYTKLAAQQAKAGVNNNLSNPISNELDWQIEQKLKIMVRDIHYSLLRGKYNKPVDNTTKRQTKGLIDATQTNVSDQGSSVGTATIEADTEVFTIAAHGLTVGDKVTVRALTGGAIGVLADHELYYVASTPDVNTFTLSTTAGGSAVAFATDGGADVYTTAALTEAFVLDLMQDVWTSGGIQVAETATLIANASIARALTKIFITDKNYQESSRTVGGVAVNTIRTDFGTLNLMLDRHMASAALQVASLDMCMPVYQEIPGKGHFFAEPLARTGAKDRSQLYGEVGLAFGNEKAHGNVLAVHRG